MMETRPFEMIAIRRDLSSLREAVAAAVPPGQKAYLSRFLADQRAAGRLLILAYGETLAPMADRFFGEPAVSILTLGTVRHHTTHAAERAPWHADNVFFRGANGRGVTFWLTFNDAGETAPGLEFETADGPICPIVPAGSALMFGPNVRHRTQPIGGDRVSVEFRCVPASETVRTPGYLDVIHLRTEQAGGSRWLIVGRQSTAARIPLDAIRT